jgi:indole-3-glycerol phosphate synthase
MNFLQTILSHKSEEVALRKKTVPVEALREMPGFGRTVLSLSSALGAREFAVIAELKKASPSKGVLREVYDPVGIASQYESAGATAISVLTDSRFFHGTLHDLEAVRAEVRIPLLRKDFIVDPYQLVESKASGADAVLLIVAALEPSQLNDMLAEARSIGLECIVEVHSAPELRLALDAGAAMIGMNNRDLATFTTDIATSVNLAAEVPNGVLSVSESGISSQNDVVTLRRAGIRAVLVGEAFMRAKNPGEELARFLAMAEEMT